MLVLLDGGDTADTDATAGPDWRWLVKNYR